jgi:hypothetical protein
LRCRVEFTLFARRLLQDRAIRRPFPCQLVRRLAGVPAVAFPRRVRKSWRTQIACPAWGSAYGAMENTPRPKFTRLAVVPLLRCIALHVSPFERKVLLGLARLLQGGS